jgi:hypothetical protein
VHAGDPDLGGGAWHDIATEIVDRLGLSVRGREDQGVRWIAVHHGDNHIHIVATLASQDYRVVWPKNDYYRLAETLREVEEKYGLQILVKADRTAARGLTRPEMERSARTGREPDRSALYRTVRTVASAARTEEEFFAALEARASWCAGGPRRPGPARSPGTPSRSTTARASGPSGTAAASSRPT